MDCVGPLPRSKMGNEYLLTVMCQVTRYPAVYPLSSLNAKLVIKALTQCSKVRGSRKEDEEVRGDKPQTAV